MMIYRAARRLSVIPKGTEQELVYQPGDIVPDFTAWPEVVRRAHLNQGNVVMDIPGQPVVVSEERTDDPGEPDPEDAAVPSAAAAKRGRRKKSDEAQATT